MAYIGMRNPVAAPVSSHTDGSAITYGAGFVMGTAVEANISFETNDNIDYGNDIPIDNDNGINGYSGTVDTNDLAPEVREKLLGWVKKTGTGSTVSHYSVTDDPAPEVGFGFVHVGMFRGVRYYDAYWYHKARFTMANIRAMTKQRQIDWNHPQLSFTGLGAYIDGTGKASYFDYMRFDTEAAANAWLNGRAGIT